MGAEEPVRRRRKDSGARREKRAESLSSASGLSFWEEGGAERKPR